MHLDGVSVFIAEDEALVAMNLEDMLMDLGCRVVGPAMRLEQAEAMLDACLDCDAAILDVNLGGDLIFGFAERLKRHDKPLIFATGYGREGLPPEWRDETVLQKPYTAEDVAASLAAVVER